MLPIARRRGQASCALLENLPDNGLPMHGGTATSVVVNLDLDALLTVLGIAEAGHGTRITAEQARRLACTARIIPARPTTGRSPGDKAAAPTSPTASPCAPSTTTAPTTRAGRPATTPTGPRPSTGASESAALVPGAASVVRSPVLSGRAAQGIKARRR